MQPLISPSITLHIPLPHIKLIATHKLVKKISIGSLLLYTSTHIITLPIDKRDTEKQDTSTRPDSTCPLAPGVISAQGFNGNLVKPTASYKNVHLQGNRPDYTDVNPTFIMRLLGPNGSPAVVLSTTQGQFLMNFPTRPTFHHLLPQNDQDLPHNQRSKELLINIRGLLMNFPSVPSIHQIAQRPAALLACTSKRRNID